MAEKLYRKTSSGYEEVYNLNYIKNIIDSESSKSLTTILGSFNNIYVPYQDTVENTRNLIPESMRRKGLWITYNNGTKYITEYYKGNLEDIQEHWTDSLNWQIIPDLEFVQSEASKLPDGIITPDKLSPALQELIKQNNTVTNLPDDEDLQERNGVLSLKDRRYNQYIASGKGYKILRKNWVKSRNILTQDMISESNTIYEIRYDFDLNDKIINIPVGSTLKFNGGSLNNGTINCNNTIIKGDAYQIFSNITITGSHSDEAYVEWFYSPLDNSYNKAFKNTLTSFRILNFISRKVYLFDEDIIDCCTLEKPYSLNGNHCIFKNFSLAYNIRKDDTMMPNDSSGIAFHCPIIKDILFDRSNINEHLRYPAFITARRIEITGCGFIGYTYCIGITPVYIDSIIVNNVSQWDNLNFIVCCDYDGNVIEDRTFNGDWFYISNTNFLNNENIVFGGIKSSFSIIFNNCLHGILQLPKIERYVHIPSNIIYLHCHFENPKPCIQYMSSDHELNGRNIIFDNCFFYSTAVPLINGIIYRKCDINIGNSNNFAIDIQKFMSGTYMITAGTFTPLLVDTSKSIDTSRTPSYTYNKYKIYAYNNDKYSGDFTYSEDREESFAYVFSDNPDTITWGDFEPTNNIVFNDYTLIKKGKTLTLELYYDSTDYGDLNCYLWVFKKIKGDDKIYKSIIYLTKELHNSIFNSNKFILIFGNSGGIGSKWEEYKGELNYTPIIKKKGTFAQKPTQGINQGFAYFCTDKQTTEGSRNGIMIYYAGNNTWVDALGRVVN